MKPCISLAALGTLGKQTELSWVSHKQTVWGSSLLVSEVKLGGHLYSVASALLNMLFPLI